MSDPTSLALSLVREFLARSGYHRALETLYDELGAKPPPTSTAIVARELGIAHLLKQNKRHPAPVKTLIEMVARDLQAQSAANPDIAVEEVAAAKGSKSVRGGKDKTRKKKRKSQKQKQKPTADSLPPRAGWTVDVNALSTRADPVEQTKDHALPDPVATSRDSAATDIVFEDIEDGMETVDVAAPSWPVGQNATEGASLARWTKSSRPITSEEAVAVRSVCFGGAQRMQCFPEAWMAQAFGFLPAEQATGEDMGFALVQNKGGPCGVLAVVQAEILAHLLFEPDSSADSTPRLQPHSQRRNEALAAALTNVLWRVGRTQRCCRVVHNFSHRFQPARAALGYAPDGFTEGLQVLELSTRDDVLSFVLDSVDQYMDQSKPIVPMFVYSVILTKGVDNLRKEMDCPDTSLISTHGYCTQELVNLCLVGYASSNVFDGEKMFGEGLVKGIRARSKIGFLTLFEHYNLMQVGSRLKAPDLPVWVVCSESHFSVLFSQRRLSLQQPSAALDLYYYDELAGQTALYKLTVVPDPSPGLDLNPGADEDLIPPLNCVIRTKWKDAAVDWNGRECIL